MPHVSFRRSAAVAAAAVVLGASAAAAGCPPAGLEDRPLRGASGGPAPVERTASTVLHPR